MLPNAILNKASGATFIMGGKIPWIADASLEQYQATSTTCTMPVPAGTKVGDLLVCALLHRGTLTPPSGWVLAKTAGGDVDGSTSQWCSMYTKTADAGDLGQTRTWTQSVSGRISTCCVAIRGWKTGVIASQGVVQATANSMAMAGLTADGPFVGISALASVYALSNASTGMNQPDGWAVLSRAVRFDAGSNPCRFIMVGKHFLDKEPYTLAGNYTYTGVNAAANAAQSVTVAIQ